jgi:hypothetical protein
VALKVGRSKRGAQLAQVSVLAQRGFDLDPSIGVWLRERRMTLVKTLNSLGNISAEMEIGNA